LNYIEFTEALTRIQEVGSAPQRFVLEQNYPNPFNPSTLLRFVVPHNGQATVKVYNTLGQHIATLFDQTAEAGKYYQLQFDAPNIPSGIYFASLESGGQRLIRKMTVIK
jgi:hypothetical protein